MKTALAAAACMLAGPCAWAAQSGAATDLGYSLSLGASHTDNAGRTQQATRETETSLEAGLGLDLRHERGRVAASLAADLAYRSHDYGGYEDELLGGLAGEASWRFAPWLTWVASDNFGQSLIDSRSTATPDNTQNTNIFSTGPDILLPFGTRTSLLLQGRWSDVSYQHSPFGTRRGSGTAGLRHRFSSRFGVSLNASTEHVDYKSLPTTSNYDIHSVYLGWDATGASTTLNLRAGHTTLEESGDSSNSALIGLDLRRQLTARSTLSFNAARSFGSSADLLRRDQDIGGVGVGDRPGVSAADPMRADSARLSWEFRGERMSVGTALRWEREAHSQESDQNRRSLGGSLTASRRIGPRLTMSFTTDYLRDEFGIADIEADEWSAGLGLQWAVTRNAGVGIDWVHLVGDGDTSAGPGTRDYTENRYTVRLTWSPSR